MKKIISDIDLLALVLLIIFVVSIFLIFPEKKKKKKINADNNQKVIKEIENDTLKTTIYQNNKTTEIINEDIYLSPKIGNIVNNKNINQKNKKDVKDIKQNNEDFIITNIKILDKNLEEKNVFNYNSDVNVVFDYNFPKGIYFFSITLDLDEEDNIEISPQRDELRNYYGSTNDKPISFNLKRSPNTEPIIIKNIIIKVFKVFEDEELPKYVYEHPINLTFETKKDKDIEEKEKEMEEENMPDIIISPSYSGIDIPSINLNENDIKNVQTGNKNHTVADNSDNIRNEESECSKINDILRLINISDVTKNDILKIESIIPSLELCAKNDGNAKKYLNFYFEQKEKLNNMEMKKLNKGNNINEKIFNNTNNELNLNNEINDPENSNMSFVNLESVNNNPQDAQRSNLEKQEIDRNLKLQSNKKISINNNQLEINPLSQNTENNNRINIINNALKENFY